MTDVRRRSRAGWSAAGLAVLLAAIAGADRMPARQVGAADRGDLSPALRQPERTPSSGLAAAADIRRYRLPDVALTDMLGNRVQLAVALRDPAPIIIEFMYTTCAGICPITSALLAQVQDAPALAGARIWSVTIDPEADTPERLQLYAQSYDAGPGWRFFTGAPDDIVALQSAFAAYRGNKMRHEPLIFIRAEGDRWMRLAGMADAADLVDGFRRAARR
jgi:protein SCO1/2